MKPDDVIITGGGMVGMSAAIALARLGLRVTVVEKTALPSQLEPQFDGRVSAIALGSARLLQAIGAWEKMRPYAEPICDIRVSDGDTPFFVHYDHADIGDEPFGHIVENRYIRHALHETAAQLSTLTLIDNATITSFTSDHTQACITLADGRELRAALVLAADGKHSSVREFAGIKAMSRDYHQTAIVCTIAHEKPHHGLAQERFLPNGPFAVLPMLTPSPVGGGSGWGHPRHNLSTEQECPPPDLPPAGGGNRSSLVWVEPADRAQIYLDLPKEECEQEITERVGSYLGKITLAGERFAYPLVLTHAERYVGPRFALIGDAAHGIHPIAGQGVNLGFRDVAVIEELVRKHHALGLDIGGDDLLTHYQQWRRFDNVTMMAVTDGLNQLFLSSWLPVKGARGIGMWAVNRLPPLKRFFMKHAMGLTGDVPSLILGPDPRIHKADGSSDQVGGLR